MAAPDATKWLGRLFDPLFFDDSAVLTRDPALHTIKRSDNPLVPIVSLVGQQDESQVPAKGLILAPFHVPRLLNDPVHGVGCMAEVEALVDSVQSALREAYGPSARVRHLIWAGMGGSIEDKYAALACGLMREDDVQLWGVDDVNRDTLAHVFNGILSAARSTSCGQAEASESSLLKTALEGTVVVAQALGMTSVEPVFNVQQAFAPAYRTMGLALATHFYKLTIPGSLLDLALASPVVSLPHQPKGQSSCAGRHDYVSYGMLLPLCLLGTSPAEYAASLAISNEEVAAALGVAQWLFDVGVGAPLGSRREAVLLLLPTEWRGRWEASPGRQEWRDVSLWFKQHVEESLGKSPQHILKVVTTLDAPTDCVHQAALVVSVPGLTTNPADCGAAIAAAGAPIRTLHVPGEGGPLALGRLMQAFTVLKYRLAELWGVCAVNQPPVECYKRIVGHLEGSASKPGVAPAADLFGAAAAYTAHAPEGLLSVSLAASVVGGGFAASVLDGEMARLGLDPASPGDLLGIAHRVAIANARPRRCYGEAIVFGNLTRGPEARKLRDLLSEAFARSVWADAAHSFADVGKGPAVGHATHAMGKQGSVLTVSILLEKHNVGPVVGALEAYPDSYQQNNAFANVLALAGFDLAEGCLAQGSGHPGMVALVRMARNDDLARAALRSVLERVADVVRMP